MTKNTLTKTKSSRDRVAFIEGGQGIGFETAAIAASASPLGIISMGTFPFEPNCLGPDHASGFRRRPHSATELESLQQIEMKALTEQVETTKRIADGS